MKKRIIYIVIVLFVVVFIIMNNYKPKIKELEANIPENFNVSRAVIYKEIGDEFYKKTEDNLSVILPIIEDFNSMKFQFFDGPPYRNVYYTFGFYNPNNEFIKINIVSEDTVWWEISTRIKDSDTNTYHFKTQRAYYQLVDAKFDFNKLEKYYQSFKNISP